MKTHNVLSLGGGVQSTAIALMSVHGLTPKIDFAIFSDTGWESQATLNHVQQLSKLVDFPIYTASNGDLLADLRLNLSSSIQYFTPPPFFNASGSIGQRQCTTDYKIVPLRRKLRDILGFKARARLYHESVNMQIGISLDEFHRSKPSNVQYINHVFPLLNLRLTRLDCENWLKKHGYQVPVKSACVGCPFHSNAEWQRLKTDFYSEFQTAIQIDELLRDFREPEYMHKSLKPINKVRFVEDRQADLFGNECFGMCAV